MDSISKSLRGLEYAVSSKNVITDVQLAAKGMKSTATIVAKSDVRNIAYLVHNKHKKAIDDTLKALHEQGISVDYFKNGPLFYFVVDIKVSKVKVVTHPNLSIPLGVSIGLNPVSRYINLLPVWEKYNTIMEGDNDKAKSKWSSMLKVKEHMEKTQTTTLGRFLQNTVFKDNKLAAKELAELVSSLSSSLLPPQLRMCESTEDYIEMYSSGPTSCMSINNSAYQNNKSNWKSMLDTGVHPCSFYHYMPNVQGVFMKKGKVVQARGLIQTDARGQTYLGRVYGMTGAISAAFKTAVKDQYNTRALELMSTPVTQEFSIPAVWDEAQKDYMGPAPYVDDMDSSKFYVKFDIPTKTFLWKYVLKADTKSEYKEFGLSSTSGYILAKQILMERRFCMRCGVSLTQHDGEEVLHSARYCSYSCADYEGFEVVTNSHGAHTLISSEDVVNASGRAYTSLSAAQAHSSRPLYPYIKSGKAKWDGRTYGSVRIASLENGKKYSFPSGYLDAARDSGVWEVVHTKDALKLVYVSPKSDNTEVNW